MILKKIDQIEDKISLSLSRFFQLSGAGGILLVAAAAFALLCANTPLNHLYQSLLQLPITIYIGDFGISKSTLHWINDGLMAVFFFLVGLEIKREVIRGELSSKEQATLPIIAAIGGMLVPALLYYWANIGHPENLQGWAIPAATDIAFALGILALLGTRAPVSLKILLTAIAVIDDIGAVIIIAIFYTSNLSLQALSASAVIIAALFILKKSGNKNIAPFIWLGIFLWIAVLKSGVHATLSGVVTALFIPLSADDTKDKSPAEHLEHILHPWVAFIILPIFAFANAGVSFKGVGIEQLTSPVTMGIFLGLFVGKQIGVFGPMFCAIKLGIAKMPKNTNWVQLYALSLLCGIGFTMSLFIGALAFDVPNMESSVRLGVLVGSLSSALLGYTLLRLNKS